MIACELKSNGSKLNRQMRDLKFDADMFSALVAGLKTQTRRVMKPQPIMTGAPRPRRGEPLIDAEGMEWKPRYHVGELVRAVRMPDEDMATYIRILAVWAEPWRPIV